MITIFISCYILEELGVLEYGEGFIDDSFMLLYKINDRNFTSY
jgi:hypothetical protein